MWQLWNHQEAIATGVPMSKEGLQKRTLACHRQRDVGECRYLFRKGGALCAPVVIPRRIYSMRDSKKEVLTSWEGCMSLDKRGDPRILRRPRHKRKQDKDILLKLWGQTFSDNGVLCQGNRVSKVLQLQPMLDPPLRSVNCFSLYITALLVRAWTLAIGPQTFASSLCSYN